MMPRSEPNKPIRRLAPTLVQAALVCLVATTASALTIAQCDRVTHVSHGGESDQTDLGEGRVMWINWWSQEGTSTDITIMECRSGQALRFRAAEANMTRGRTPFDKTDDALEVIALHESGARVFATFDRIARDIEEFQADTESCACAAAYPVLRNGKTPFDLDANTATPFSLARP
ncbi:MAG: hypothetical protein AAFP98_07410 [Pseudomonadota bacterium]